MTATLAVRPGAQHSRVLSVGSYRPERVVTNDELAPAIDSSDSWIRERSGIVTRGFAGPHESVTDMAAGAAASAISRAGLEPNQIDAVLVATVSHLLQTPSVAAVLAHRLGATGAMALDLSAACSGFCHGVAMASDMIRAGSARHVVVVGVEKLTDLLDLTDRGTAFIFADGAGAVVVGPSDTPGIGPVVWGSDGSQADAITQRDPWDVVCAKPDASPTLTMAGQSVFRWAISKMAPVAAQAIEQAGITVADLDAFIPHQANLRIIEQMATKLGLAEHTVVARDIVDAGNTSAASIPLAMDRLVTQGQVRSGGLALLIGFGAGLTYASQVIELP